MRPLLPVLVWILAGTPLACARDVRYPPSVLQVQPTAQYQCDEGTGSPDAKRACRSNFLAAAARAAAEAGGLSGITRVCLLKYAALQERAARLIRSGKREGYTLQQTLPECYARNTPQWDYEALARACPRGRWTAENWGVASCEAAPARALPAVGAESPGNEPPPGKGMQQDAKLRETIRTDPRVGAYHASRGALLRQQGRLFEAERELREAVRLEPDHPSHRREHATIVAALKEQEATAAQLREAVRQDSADRAPAAGMLQREQPEPASAEADAQRVPVLIRIATTLLRTLSAVLLGIGGAMLLLPTVQALYLLLIESVRWALRRTS
jgi:tetratricopeptide (TPR) repeat protein